MSTFRIAALSGSLRAASINTALLHEIAARAPDWFAVDIVPLGVLPLFNPDLEAALPTAVAAFHADVAPRARHAIAALREILATMSAQIVDELPNLATANYLSRDHSPGLVRPMIELPVAEPVSIYARHSNRGTTSIAVAISARHR